MRIARQLGGTLAALLVVSALLAAPVNAAEAYLFAFQAWGAQVEDPTLQMGTLALLWQSDAVLHNNGPNDARIELLDQLSGISFSVPPHRTVSLLDQVRSHGAELLSGEIGVVHLTMPNDVIIESTLYVNAASVSFHSPPLALPWYGKVHVPTFTALVPANEPQVHLDTWLGMIASHRNVLIYNAGTVPARVLIDVRQQCDDALVSSTTNQVAAGNIIHVVGLPGATTWFGRGASCGKPTFMQAGVYTVVTVDQPSLTLVSSVADDRIPTASLSIN